MARWLYFQTLSGPMYRIDIRWTDDPSIDTKILSRHIELWFETPPLGGTAMDAQGNIYFEDLTSDAVRKLTPQRKVTTIIQDSQLHWADAPWIWNGWLYLPEAQLDRIAPFQHGVGLCDRLDRTRANSQRQLPTDHDYAVPTREYQTDQSSLKTAPTAVRSV